MTEIELLQEIVKNTDKINDMLLIVCINLSILIGISIIK